VTAEANDRRRPKVFIIKTEYGYAVSPSPVVAKSGATLYFENLTNVKATVSIPGAKPADFEVLPHKPESVTILDSMERVTFYTVEMDELYARGNSAPIIIRDP